MDTTTRTLIKALIWNALGLLTMGAVGFVMTGSVMMGGMMAAINTMIGLSVYVVYERVWARIRWGRQRG